MQIFIRQNCGLFLFLTTIRLYCIESFHFYSFFFISLDTRTKNLAYNMLISLYTLLSRISVSTSSEKIRSHFLWREQKKNKVKIYMRYIKCMNTSLLYVRKDARHSKCMTISIEFHSHSQSMFSTDIFQLIVYVITQANSIWYTRDERKREKKKLSNNH